MRRVFESNYSSQLLKINLKKLLYVAHNVKIVPTLFQVTLNIYTFENVAYHVLHQRIPEYPWRTLTAWWDQRTGLVRLVFDLVMMA